MEFAAPISVAAARAIVKAHVRPGKTEVVPVLEAVGRVLARDVTSDIDVAPFDDSAMDGFAVVAADLAAASPGQPVQLRCVAHIGAGDVFGGVVHHGEAARIMTGALMPEGADAVVKIEDIAFGAQGGIGDVIGFSAPVAAGCNVRPAGEEAMAGEVICRAGDVVNTAGAGLFASCGALEVEVYARPVVGIICIGSELVQATEVPPRGKIRNSNVWAQQALVREAGGIPRVYGTVPDDVEAIRELYARAAAECDAVVSTGGACLGDFDLTGDVVCELGRLYFGRVDVKPGKSQPFGEINGTPVFVLSGNPAASAVGFELYVRLALRIMQGFRDLERPRVQARIACDVRKGDRRMWLERAVIGQLPSGELEVVTLQKQSSALYGALQRCNCLAVIPADGAGVAAGDIVTCLLTSVDESMPVR